jgi:hypothetical protein
MKRTLQALFSCNDVLERKDRDGSISAQIVKCNAVYENNPDHPNYVFWKATPTASLEMTISNPDAFDVFVPGRKYLLTFEAVES